MASGGEGITVTYEASADLSGSQYYIVKMSSGKIALCSSDEDKALGILQNKPESGENAVVMTAGISKMVCGGSLSETEGIASDADGKGAPLTDADSYSLCNAVQAGEAGDIIRVSLNHNGKDAL